MVLRRRLNGSENNNMAKKFVIIPGFNESRYLDRVLKKVKDVTSDIIFVDDGSSDESVRIAKKYTPHVLAHETNLGKGAAMLTGANYAFDVLGAEAVVFMDSDDQHDPEHLEEFFKKLGEYDVVLGVRTMGSNMPFARYMGNKFASVLLNWLYGTYIDDIPSGYKGIHKRAFTKLKWSSSGYEVETEIAVRIAQHHIPFGLVEIKSIYHDTDKGMTLLDAIHIGVRLLQWRLGI